MIKFVKPIIEVNEGTKQVITFTKNIVYYLFLDSLKVFINFICLFILFSNFWAFTPPSVLAGYDKVLKRNLTCTNSVCLF